MPRSAFIITLLITCYTKIKNKKYILIKILTLLKSFVFGDAVDVNSSNEDSVNKESYSGMSLAIQISTKTTKIINKYW